MLFLDEAPEFSVAVLDALREPLESGVIALARSGGTARYPARFRLVLAANPCPCGLATGKGRDCRCAPAAKRRYLGRLSGPLLDRIDLRLHLDAPTAVELAGGHAAESTAEVAVRVAAAQRRTAHRLTGTPFRVNADVPGRRMRRQWPPTEAGLQLLDQQLARGALTMRGADRVLRVAWTLADLAGLDRPGRGEVNAALSFRRTEAAAA